MTEWKTISNYQSVVSSLLVSCRAIASKPRCREGHYSIPWNAKLATLVEGDPKVPFSIATTPRCREGHYSIPWKVKLATFVEGDLKGPFSITTTAMCKGGRSTFFESLV